MNGKFAAGPVWTIQGKVRSAFRSPPTVVSFGSISDLANGPLQADFELVPTRTLSTLSAELTPPVGTVAITPLNLRYRGQVTLRTPLGPLGRQTATLRLHGIAQSGENLPVHEIPVIFQVAPDVQPRHQTRMLGALTAGEVASGEFEFFSLTGTNFRVRPTVDQRQGIAVRSQSPEVPNVLEVSVPVENGAQTVKVDFTVSQANRADYRVPVEFVYHGK